MTELETQLLSASEQDYSQRLDEGESAALSEQLRRFSGN